MSEKNESKATELQTEIANIEANLAFFTARFALIEHQPDTAYKRAQTKAYEALQSQLQSRLSVLKLQQKQQRSINKK